MRTRKAEEIRMRYQYRRLILVGQKHPPQDGRAPHRIGLHLSPICHGRSSVLVQYLTNFS